MFPAFRAKTSAILVDDEGDFLNDICDFLPATHNLIKYQNPKSALEVINNNHTQYKNFPLKNLATIWGNFKSFNFEELLSVAIVDHRMAPIDGIDLCKSIKTPFIKRIMLTSHATEKLAINAFNNKIIDAFILKTEPNLVDVLVKAMEDCTKEFFYELSNWIKGYNDLHNPLLSDKSDKFLSKIFIDKSICKYCCIHDFNTIWLKSNDNKEYFLTIYSDETLDELLSTEQSQYAPLNILNDISNKKAAPCFPFNNTPLMPNGKYWASYMKPLIPIDLHLYGAIS